jgi:hypothetical protein
MFLSLCCACFVVCIAADVSAAWWPPDDQMILYYRKQHGTGLPLRHILTVGLHIASALWHLHPSIVHR